MCIHSCVDEIHIVLTLIYCILSLSLNKNVLEENPDNISLAQQRWEECKFCSLDYDYAHKSEHWYGIVPTLSQQN